MCGILGWIGHGDELRATGEDALAILAHRGPDAARLWIDPTRRVALGSRRLAVLDRRSDADQPMVGGEDRLVHNGAIYNYVELRDELERLGDLFSTTSDTEVLLAAVQRWRDDALPRLDGMFAFALWDAGRSELFLARDRFGEKPLYYVQAAACFHFASEIKALLRFPCVATHPDLPTLYRFVATGRVADGTTSTFFGGVSQLRPGSCMRVDRSGTAQRQTRYWRLGADPAASRLSFSDAVEGVRELFVDSLRVRLRSDVPLGTSLSGGVDSSLVVLTTADLLQAPFDLRTYSARYEDADADEGKYIDAVVAVVSARSTALILRPDDLMRAADSMIRQQDEPFAHTSPFTQARVYALARASGTTVMLDGQGADELFGGYETMAFGGYWASLLSRGALVALGRDLIAHRSSRHDPWTFAAGAIANAFLSRSFRSRLRAARDGGLGLVPQGLRDDMAAVDVCASCPDMPDLLRRELAHALLCTSLPALLRYTDRASMANSIEVRLPFLDHRLASFAMGLPAEHLVGAGRTKRVLREILRPRLSTVADRAAKIGFTVPEARWLRGPLRPWLESVLRSAERRGLHPPGSVEAAWAAVQAGRAPAQLAWRLAVSELWLRAYVDGLPPDA